MTPDERRASRIESWRAPELHFASDEAMVAYRERVDRLIAAISLETPDRVPVNIQAGFWPGKRAGLTPFQAMRHPQRVNEAWKRFNLDFEPDAFVDPGAYAVSASALAAVDYRLYSWPGHGTARNVGYQYNENEWMLPEEYDHLIADPSDYLYRVYLPRTVGAFAGFAGLSPCLDYLEIPAVPSNVGAWGSPEMAQSLKRIAQAARHAQASESVIGAGRAEVMGLGYPPLWGGMTKAPFDILGDTLRGTKGIIFDLYRRPEKVVAACERLVQVALNWYLRRPKPSVAPVVFMPLHKGADGFMSDEQYRTFYWPSLRDLIQGLIAEGLIPCLFAEGRYETRLDVITDVPRGKTVWLFDQTDMSHAKQTIGRVACIQGNVPLSLLYAGTPAQVTTYCQTLIDVAADGGGFILDMGAKADAGKEENLRAMVTVAKKYGAY